MELVPVNRSAPSPPRASPPRQPTDASSKRPVREERFKCRVCHRSHPLRYCKRFLDANYERRLRLVLLHRYCSRCLAHSHGAKNCQSKGMCEYCKEKHHTLLHSNPRLSPSRQLPPLLTQLSGTVTVLPTIAIYVHIGQRKFLTRALLDPCSQTSKVCESLVKRLRLQTLPVANLEMCELHVSSSNDARVRFAFPARVIAEVGLKTPARHLNQTTRDKFINLTLADPNFHTSSAVALILGGDIYHKIIRGEIISFPGYPTAQNSIFGWVLSGPCAL